MSDLTLSVCGAERVADLEPLWRALHAHHVSIAPQLGADRSPAESWARRRHKYAHWLAEEGSFVVLAADRHGLIGYALVRLVEGSETWATPDVLGELETLSVLPRARGGGVGTALIQAVFAQLRARGVRQLSLGVIASNERSRRFYERWGLVPVSVQYRGEIPEYAEGQIVPSAQA